jgi:hypothetical protein
MKHHSNNNSTANTHLSPFKLLLTIQFTMVKTIPFGDITVPSPGFGAMGMSFGLGSNLSLEEAEPVLLKAIELGCTFWDTAVCPSKGVVDGHGRANSL